MGEGIFKEIQRQIEDARELSERAKQNEAFLQAFKNEFEKISSERNDLSDAIDWLQAQEQKLRSELELVQRRLSQFDQAEKTVSERLEIERRSALQRETFLMDKCQQLQTLVDESEKKRRNIIDNLQEAEHTAQAENKKLNDTLIKLEAELKLQKERLAWAETLESELRHERTRSVQADELLQRTRKDLEEARRDCELERARYQSVLTGFESWQKTIASADKEDESLRKRCDELEAQTSLQTRRADDLHYQLQTVLTEAQKLKTQAASDKQSLIDKDEALLTLERRLSRANSESAILSDQLAANEKRLRDLEQRHMDQIHGLKERLAQAERGSGLADSRVADERTRRQEVEAEAAALRKQIEFVERNLATAESRIHDLTRANEDLQRRHQFELDRARQATSFERQGDLAAERRVFRETLDELRREMQTLVRAGAERAPENRLGATAAEQARAASRLRESVRTANRKAADQAHIMNLLDKLSKNLPEIVE